MNGRFKNYLVYVVASCSLLFSSFFSNATIYGTANISTPYLNGDYDFDDDYKYNLGIRKIALFDYQDRDKFYKEVNKRFIYTEKQMKHIWIMKSSLEQRI